MTDDPDDDGPSRRQVAKAARRDAGDRSSELARRLMLMSDATLEKLDLDEDLHTVIARARSVKPLVARRRAERTLAGDLRRVDLADLRKRIANVETTGVAVPALLHRAEKWRARLIAEGPEAAAEFPGGTEEPMPRLIAQAKREATTGKPPGAARALFRHVITVLKARAHAAEAAEADAGDDE
jgi:ribosome-associated protein